jgi:glycosyltransferase involved in cell wall biosynthesis
MRILFVTPWFPNRTSPRHGNFVERFVEMVATRHEVEVLHIEEDKALRAGTLESSVREKDYGRAITVYYGGAGARVQRLWARRKAWQKAIALLQLKPQLVHAHVLIDGGIVAEKLAKKFRVPFLISEHSSRHLRPIQWNRWPERYLARVAAAKAAAILPVSPTLARAMKSRGFRGHYRVVPNVVDDSLFHPRAPEPDRKTVRFLHVSDASPNKRPDLLIKAFALAHREVPQLHLHLGTDGEQEPLRELINSWNLPHDRITLSGPHSPGEIAELMQTADYFVLTSRHETQSVVLVEALLSGLYCLSTEAGGPQDILNQASLGELVSDSPEVMAHRFVSLSKLPIPNLAHRMAIHQEAKKRFGKRHTQQLVETIYQQTVQ